MRIKMKILNIFILLLIALTNCNGDFVEENELASNTFPSEDNKILDEQNLELNSWDNEGKLYEDRNTPAKFAIHKRAPSPPLFGVRGRRQDRPSGFLGVRGKKSNYDDSFEDEWNSEYNNDGDFILFDEYYEEQHDRRKPQGEFMDLRLKKSAEETPEFVLQKKRVPVTSFFGIAARGKKEPLTNDYYRSSNFFGVRKKPSNPYMKFVGVRGKKAVKRETRHLRFEENNDHDSMNGLRMLQRRGSPPDKSIGFIGMRG